jgi:hypothetical protein
LEADVRAAGGVEVDLAAVEGRHERFQLVGAATVGIVAGGDREIERPARDRARPNRVEAADHRIDDMGRQGLLRPEGVGEGDAAEAAGILPDERGMTR